MAINHQVVPQEGWRFREEKTETLIIALDWAGLVRHVRDHRKANGLDIGDVEGDIDAYIEKEHPYLVI